jgi:hypothetical protein
VRGTANWDGDKLVNDYKEVVEGKRTKFRRVPGHHIKLLQIGFLSEIPERGKVRISAYLLLIWMLGLGGLDHRP